MNRKTCPKALLGSALAGLFLLASPLAQAGFTNGGFETGDFTGWDVKYGLNYGIADLNNPLASVTWSTAWDQPLAKVADLADTDANIPNFKNRFVGNKMALINDINGMYHVTQISQVGTIDDTDLNGGSSASLFINWMSVMVDPWGHPPQAQPWFNIEVTKNGLIEYQVTHFSNEPGWTLSSNTFWGEPIYWDADQVKLDGLLKGDEIGVKMTVADCSYSGHGGYAYLDGIGTSKIDNPDQVPETTSTIGLMLLGIAGLLGLRRKLN